MKSTELKTTWSAVTDVIKNYSWRAIYANSDEDFDEIIAEMIDEAEAYGYDECMEYLTRQAETRYEEEQSLEN